MAHGFDGNEKIQALRAAARIESRVRVFAFVRTSTALTFCPDCGECIEHAREVCGIKVDGVHACRGAA